MSELVPFSQRHGHLPVEPNVTIRHEAPRWLREHVVDLAYKYNLKPSTLRSNLCSLLLECANSNNWSEYPNIDGEVRDLLGAAEWFYVYDFIELIADRLRMQGNEEDFTVSLNSAFRRKGVGWQLVNGKIAIRGEEAFEYAVRAAIVHADSTGRTAASRELHEALQDLSKRPRPDVTGSIQHAMAAMECVARTVASEDNATLGAIIRRNPNLLPKPLDRAVEQLWGFASEQARHVQEGKTIDLSEAELAVGLAASITTFLIKSSLLE